jgi:hypothetical protein
MSIRNVDLRGLFTSQSIAETLKALPPLKTTVIDKAFKATATHPLPTIGIAELKHVTGVIPFVRRGSDNIKISPQSSEAMIFAPLPLKPSIEVTAAELNDLQLIFANSVSKSEWISAKVDELRQIIRKTTEALAAGVLTTGKLSWPIKLSGGGMDTFTVDYGAPLTYTPAVAWNATGATLKDIYDTLTDMDNEIQEAGFGGKVEFLCGRDAFGQLINIAQGWAAAASANPISITLKEGSAEIAGYTIHRVSERCESPLSGEFIDKIGANSLIGFVADSSAKVIYCAVDSLSADNRALPFHVFPEEKADSVVVLTAQAKPVPARNPKTVCIATVVVS